MTKTSKWISSTALASAVFLAAPLASNAADLDPPVQAAAEEATASNIYISVFGGANFLSDIDFTNGATEVETDYDTGFSIGGAIGYKWSDHKFGGFSPRTELEFSYFDNSVDGINFSGNGPGEEVVLGGSDVTGFNVFANLFFDYDTGTRFTPYVGGGLGITRADFDIAYNAANLNLSDNDTSFAWHIGGGANFALTDSVSFFADARYQRTSDAGSIRNIADAPVPAGPGGGFFEDNLSNVLVRGGLTFNF